MLGVPQDYKWDGSIMERAAHIAAWGPGSAPAGALAVAVAAPGSGRA